MRTDVKFYRLELVNTDVYHEICVDAVQVNQHGIVPISNGQLVNVQHDGFYKVAKVLHIEYND